MKDGTFDSRKIEESVYKELKKHLPRHEFE
jgi:hypothetical protein